jgi:hypothetical protein
MMDQKKKFWSTEMMVAVASILVGFCALAITAVQTYIMREQQYASVWPSVSYGTGNTNQNDADSTASFDFTISNRGIGPAIIQDIKIVYRDTLYEDWQRQEFFQTMAGTKAYVGVGYTSISKNRVIQAGETIIWWQFKPSRNGYKILKAMYDRNQKGFDIIVFYSDIYGHSWVTRQYDQTEECDNCQQQVLKGYKKYAP